jgi:hypothetical protein
MFSSLRIAAAGASAALVSSLLVSGAGAQTAFRNQEGAIHFMLTPSYAQQIGRVPNRNASGPMLYYGGTVFPRVAVVSVMWGKTVSTATKQGMPGFLKAIVNSTFQDQLAQYGTVHAISENQYGSRQNIARGTFLGQVVIKPHNTSTTLSDADVHRELLKQISEGKLPGNDTDTLYMIYFPLDVTIEAFGLKSCVNFGAYHNARTPHVESVLNIFYGVMPDCGYSFTDHTIISAHEFAEATTDNIPTPGTNPAYPQAWNTSDGYEIGDLCEGTQGELITKKTTYYVQQVYLNSTGACSTGNYTSP